MLRLILLLILAYPTAASASDWRVMGLREFSLDVWKIADHRQSYYDPRDDGEAWHGGVATTFNLDLLRYRHHGIYWDNRVHTDGTRRQVRMVGWWWEAGIQLGS